jgi:hypothetical protein
MVVAACAGLGCAGELVSPGAAPEPPDAGVAPADAAHASPPAVMCDDDGASCSADADIPVSWYTSDGGLARCQCFPRDHVACAPIANPPVGPLGPVDCSCDVCGAVLQSRGCVFDPYFGDPVQASCVQ